MTALLLLAPQTPLLFQGQEYGSTRPFYYFADHEVDLAKLVREGHDPQLEKAVALALADLAQHPPAQPEKPKYPDYHH